MRTSLLTCLAFISLTIPGYADDSLLKSIFDADGPTITHGLPTGTKIASSTDEPPPSNSDDPFEPDRLHGPSPSGGSGYSDYDPTKFPSDTYFVAPADSITNGDPYWDEAGTYHNKLHDGIPMDSADLNDDGIYEYGETADTPPAR